MCTQFFHSVEIPSGAWRLTDSVNTTSVQIERIQNLVQHLR